MVKMKGCWYGAKDVRIEEDYDTMYRKSNSSSGQGLRSSLQNLWYHAVWIRDGTNFYSTETEHVYSGQKVPVTLGHELLWGNCWG